tara:strand:- start:474 stop:746 length:273 start_codon:yes stop_codon:yes gene_type:complete
MILWGSADYDIPRGGPGMMFEADIMPIEELVIRKCLEYGVAPRMEIGVVDQAKRYIDMGVRHFCIGWDRFTLQAGLRNIGEGLRKLTDSI